MILQDIFGWKAPPGILPWILLLIILLLAGFIIIIRLIYYLIHPKRQRRSEKAEETYTEEIEGSDFIMRGRPYVGPYEKGENPFIIKKGAKTFKPENEKDE
jgi:NADH:ubiquinone oxidoreductase subunit 3 (subunit A)